MQLLTVMLLRTHFSSLFVGLWRKLRILKLEGSIPALSVSRIKSLPLSMVERVPAARCPAPVARSQAPAARGRGFSGGATTTRWPSLRPRGGHALARPLASRVPSLAELARNRSEKVEIEAEAEADLLNDSTAACALPGSMIEQSILILSV